MKKLRGAPNELTHSEAPDQLVMALSDQLVTAAEPKLEMAACSKAALRTLQPTGDGSLRPATLRTLQPTGNGSLREAALCTLQPARQRR